MESMNDILLIHYAEIGTKGKNRSFFERRLREDVRRRLFPLDVSRVEVESGRVVADLVEGYSRARIETSLGQVFGIAWFAYARSVAREWTAVEEAGLRCASERPDAKTFKVYAHRADKNYPLSSQEICRRLGASVVEKFGLKVDLEHHEMAVYVEVLPDRVLVYGDRVAGQRGMPRGSSGRMLCLFSGGIDSPVAAWKLMRRGAMVHLLHFHPFRKAEELRGTKIMGLFDAMRNYNPTCRLFLIPHYPYQVKAALEIDQAYEMVLFRKFMFRVGQELARRRRMKALITGDSLGQVASQTVENIAAAQADLQIPMFLPLVSDDKDDIVRLAKKIGTYELSIQPYKDCCSLMSRHPHTMASVEKVRELETKLNFAPLIEECLALTEVWDGETFSPMKTDTPAATPSTTS
jgi:thiamine biosynthesis protein ThiI